MSFDADENRYARRGESKRSDADKDSDAVKVALSRFADVLMPKDAPEPILGPSVKQALYEWMIEIGSREELEGVNVKPRRTALLYGPPGVGKTTFAHYFAARLGLPLACVRSESLIDCYLGSTGKNISQLFDAMTRTEGKVVMLFDEVDALGGKRMNDQGASVERANSLNVLLRKIEMFNGICLAATNRETHLDDALWRRFNMQIAIGLPEFDERFAIIRLYADPFHLSDDDTDRLADLTTGASPALLRGLIEGMKRTVITWPKVRPQTAATAVGVFKVVLSSVNPAPEYEKPPLWAKPSAVDSLSAIDWPLARYNPEK